MTRRFLLLDLVLLAVLVAGVLQVRRSWQEFEIHHRAESVQADPEPIRTLTGSALVAAQPEDWRDIAVKNPFSFDRNDIAIVAPTQPPTTTPKPVLFGTMSIGSEKIAMLAPSGKASKPVKIGETIDEWQVVEINDKSVVVTGANGARQTVIMNDPTAQVARRMERTGPGAQPVGNMVSSAPAPAPAGAAPTPAGATASTPAATSSTPAAQPAPAADDLLVTPFGTVKRTKP